MTRKTIVYDINSAHWNQEEHKLECICCAGDTIQLSIHICPTPTTGGDGDTGVTDTNMDPSAPSDVVLRVKDRMTVGQYNGYIKRYSVYNEVSTCVYSVYSV